LHEGCMRGMNVRVSRRCAGASGSRTALHRSGAGPAAPLLVERMRLDRRRGGGSVAAAVGVGLGRIVVRDTPARASCIVVFEEEAPNLS
jgi:hypothetical protein